MVETKSYIKIESGDYPSLVEKINAKNEELGRRKYTLSGLFGFLVHKKTGLTVEGVLDTATEEETKEYLASKVVIQREGKRLQLSKLMEEMQNNEKATIEETERTALRMDFLKRMQELLNPIVTA